MYKKKYFYESELIISHDNVKFSNSILVLFMGGGGLSFDILVFFYVQVFQMEQAFGIQNYHTGHTYLMQKPKFKIF